MIYHPNLLDCRHCDGPSELIEPSDQLSKGSPAQAENYFGYQVVCVKCGMRASPAMDGPLGAQQAITSWNQIQQVMALGLTLNNPTTLSHATADQGEARPKNPLSAFGPSQSTPRLPRNKPLRG